MRKGSFTLLESRPLSPGTRLLVLSGDAGGISAPGQFVEVRVPGLFLRRPFSVCDWTEDTLTLLVRAAGRGTEALTGLAPGAALDLLTGLGNGFDTAAAGNAPLLAGGGSGAAPLLGLARRLRAEGRTVTAVLGARTREELLLTDEIAGAGARVIPVTEDGSLGIRGLVPDALAGLRHSHVYACGPEPMLEAVAAASPVSGQFSFEARMGCGFGACMGCTRLMKSGPKRVCKDGPVFWKEEIVWQTSV